MLFSMPINIGEHKISAGKRLRAARMALGFPTIRQFAAVMGVPETNLSKWESGEALVPTYFTERLRQTFKVDHNWIYGGDPANLPHHLAVEIARVSINAGPEDG